MLFFPMPAGSHGEGRLYVPAVILCNCWMSVAPFLPLVLVYVTINLLTFKQRLKMHLFRLSYPGLTF